MTATRPHTTLALLLAAALVAAPAHAGDVQRHRLSNGVTVLTMPAHWNRIVAVSVMVDAGSRRDPPGLEGLAGITNTLLIQGTTTRSAAELAELVDGSGLSLGSEVTQDYSHVHITAIDSQLDLALDVIADVLRRPAFEEKRLLDAQRVAHDVLDDKKDDPFHEPASRVEKMLFDGHPYAIPPQGTPEGIDRITVGDVVRFHTERYVGESTVIAVVGNFDPKQVVRRLEELLADYPRGTAETFEPPPVQRSGSDTWKVFKDVDEAYVALGFHAPPSGDSDYAAIRTLDALLGLGRNSRLSRVLGPDGSGVARKVGSYCRCREAGSAFIVYGAGDDAVAVRDGILSEVERLKTEPVSDEELAAAVNQIIGRQVIAGQTNLVRAARLASYELAGLGFGFADAFLDAVKRVDKDDVMRVASEWLREPVTASVLPGRSAAPRRADTARRTGI